MSLRNLETGFKNEKELLVMKHSRNRWTALALAAALMAPAILAATSTTTHARQPTMSRPMLRRHLSC